jgi:hypothetical protein
MDWMGLLISGLLLSDTWISFQTRFYRKGYCYLLLVLEISNILTKFDQNGSKSLGVLGVFYHKILKCQLIIAKMLTKQKVFIWDSENLSVPALGQAKHTIKYQNTATFFNIKKFLFPIVLFYFCKKKFAKNKFLSEDNANVFAEHNNRIHIQ